jgi:hypothetical protein
VNSLTDFLFPAPAERSVPGIVRWWESRRLPYNLVVGGSGLVTLAVIGVVSALMPGPKPDLAGLVVGYGIAANVCYLLGPLLEIGAQKIWGRTVLPIGPALYRMGLTFSVGLTLLPIPLLLTSWVVRIVFALF